MNDIEKPQLLEFANIELYVGFNKGKVIIDFHRSVTAMEIEPQHAEIFARLLLKHAQNARGIAIPGPLVPDNGS